MASDFGDEAGGELYDWMLRIGQDAGDCSEDQTAKTAGQLHAADGLCIMSFC